MSSRAWRRNERGAQSDHAAAVGKTRLAGPARGSEMCEGGGDAIATGIMLLNRSRRKTIQKNFLPSRRATLVAPMFPLPAVHGSTPFARPTIRPKGIEPIRYASGIRIRSAASVIAWLGATQSFYSIFAPQRN